MTRPPLPRSRRLVLAAFGAMLLAGSVAHLWTGLADQGDWARTTAFLLDRPASFPREVRVLRAEERRDRFLTHWHDRWVVREAPDFEKLANASSFKLVFAAQVGFDAAVTRDRVHSMRLGSVPLRLLLLGAVLGLAALALRAPAPAAAAFLALLGASALEGTFAAFLNSAYEEQVAIVALPLLAWLVWRASLPSRRAAALALAVAAFTGASKAQLFPLPLLAAPFVWAALRDRRGWAGAARLVAAAQLAAAVPLLFNPAGGVNAYHASYAGILRTLAPEELARARIGGAPVLAECVGVQAFGPRGRDCLARAGAGFGDVARLLLAHPGAAATTFGRIVAAGTDLELAYLGRAMPGAPTFEGLPPFRAWRAAFRTLGPAMFPAVVVTTALLLGAARRSAAGRGAARAGALLGLVCATQYLAALADGLVEVPKHLVVGNFAGALCLSFGALSFAWALAARTAGRPVLPPPSLESTVLREEREG